MVLKPASIDELSEMLRSATASGRKVDSCDLACLNAMVEHTAEDMTATVQAGMTLGEFQKRLNRCQQWLPIDPPHPEQLTINQLLSLNLSGPHRYGYGMVRDYLIGIRVVLADGQFIKSGGKVVKNVAGYDLGKLFIGSKGTLGVIVEATFKLWPLPEIEVVMKKSFSSLELLESGAEELLASMVRPALLDAHNLDDGLTLVAAFAGSNEEVQHQEKIARDLGFGKGTLDYFLSFQSDSRPLYKNSIAPSEISRAISQILPDKFVAHYGNGIVYSHGGPVEKKPFVASTLMRRLKKAYDPMNIFPEYAP